MFVGTTTILNHHLCFYIVIENWPFDVKYSLQALSYGEVTNLTTYKLFQFAQFATFFVLINKFFK